MCSILKPYHVTQWLDAHEWNQSTRRGGIISVKRVFNWAVDEGYLDNSPIKRLKKPPVNRRDVVLGPEQQKAIYAAARGQCFKDFVFAMQETGCRPGEVAKVTVAMVDFQNGTAPMVELCRKLVAKNPEGPIFRNR